MEWLDEYQEEFRCFHGLDVETIIADNERDYGRNYGNDENEEEEQ